MRKKETKSEEHDEIKPDNQNVKQRDGLIDSMSVVIVFVCTLVVIGLAAAAFATRIICKPKSSIIEIKYTPIDTLCSYCAFPTTDIIELSQDLENYHNEVEEKYDFIINQKDREDFIKSFGTIFFGAIISLLGFFGFKTFDDVKKNGEAVAKETAQSEAQKTASKVAEDVAGQTAEKTLDSMVNKALDDTFIDKKSATIKESITRDIVADLQTHFLMVDECIENRTTLLIGDIKSKLFSIFEDEESRKKITELLKDFKIEDETDSDADEIQQPMTEKEMFEA